MDKIEKMQYESLRRNLNNILVKPILGDKYYNISYDVYQTDKNTLKDIRRKYEQNVQEIKHYRIALKVLIVLNAITTLLIYK